jgi:ssDNA-binding Zn-finger/Zn-ribbon topoisomerase 1
MDTPCCPRCYAQLVMVKSRLGTYLSCPNYPNCKSPLHLPKGPQAAHQLSNAA